jgi:ADP-ribosylation factor protein 1
LILANKSDLNGLTVPEVTEKLQLHSLRKRNWFIKGTCALNGDGLKEGMNWVEKILKQKKHPE